MIVFGVSEEGEKGQGASGVQRSDKQQALQLPSLPGHAKTYLLRPM